MFKDPLEQQLRTHKDKSIQVNTTELQRMEPFSRTLSAFDGIDEGYLDSPKSHFERIKLENGNVGLPLLSSPAKLAELVGKNSMPGSQQT